MVSAYRQVHHYLFISRICLRSYSLAPMPLATVASLLLGNFSFLAGAGASIAYLNVVCTVILLSNRLSDPSWPPSGQRLRPFPYWVPHHHRRHYHPLLADYVPYVVMVTSIMAVGHHIRRRFSSLITSDNCLLPHGNLRSQLSPTQRFMLVLQIQSVERQA